MVGRRLITEPRHLAVVLQEYVAYYNTHRPTDQRAQLWSTS